MKLNLSFKLNDFDLNLAKFQAQNVWKIILTCTLLGKQSKKIFAFQLLPKPHSIKIHTKQKKVRLSKSNETAKIFLR